jgi:hypothetical protein
LRSLIGDAIMLYTQNKNGEFVPVWAEETWWLCQKKLMYQWLSVILLI